MKKITALLLAVILIFSAAACNEKPAKKDSVNSKSSSSAASDSVSSDDETSSDETSSDDASSDDSSEKNESRIDRVNSGDKKQNNSNVSSTSDGKKTEEITAENIMDSLQKGINISSVIESGNALDYSNWAFDIRYYEKIKEQGFDHIRFTANPEGHFVTDAPDYKIDTEYMRVVDNIVNNAIDSGLIVVLDFFHGWTDKLINDYDTNSEKFVTVWRQVAERYRSYPNTLMFELINEPNTISDSLLNRLQMNAVEAIRETNPTRVIALAANENNGAWKIWNTEFPANDKNCMVSVHVYDPMGFTHQGATWSGPGYDKQVRLTDEGKKTLLATLEKCKNYTERTGRKIWISEWGTYLAISDKDDVSEYTNYFTKNAKAMGLSYCYWEFGQGFGIYDLKADKWKDFILDNFN